MEIDVIVINFKLKLRRTEVIYYVSFQTSDQGLVLFLTDVRGKLQK